MGRVNKEKLRKILMSNLFVVLMVIALIIGVIVGITVRRLDGWEYYQYRKIFYLRFPGDLLLNMLKMLILPLIVSSIVSSLAALDGHASGRMGLRAVLYYLITTFSAVVLGIVLVLAIRPGDKGDKVIEKKGSLKQQEPLEALFDLIRNCFPDNLIQACFEKQTTSVSKAEVVLPIVQAATAAATTAATTLASATTLTTDVTTLATNVTTLAANVTTLAANVTSLADNETTTAATTTMAAVRTISVDRPKVTNADGMNVLGIVVFSCFFGAIISRMGPAGKPLLDLFESMHIAIMKLTMLVIWYSPIGIIFLVATKLIEMEDPEKMFVQLGYYMLTVLVGLAIHGIIVLPVIYAIFLRKNPFLFMWNMLKALLTAWGTASSSATLPVTMECLEMRNNVDIRVAKFVAPIGATVNMDGTALYEAVAAIFIAQVNGIPLSVGQVITISLTSTAAAIGAAGIPSAGLVTMAIVLTAVDLPVDDIRLIIAIDWFLDRFRTAINVLGDSFGAAIVEKLSRNDLDKFDSGRSKISDSEETEETFQEKSDTGLENSGFILNNRL